MLFTQTLHAAAAQLDTPLPSLCPSPGKLCHLHNLWGEQGRADVAGGTGERFILKQFKIFSCNYMSTSRKTGQDNGENGARSRATAARLFIGKHKYKYAYKHRCKWQTQIQWTDACAFGYVRVSPEIFAYCEL